MQSCDRIPKANIRPDWCACKHARLRVRETVYETETGLCLTYGSKSAARSPRSRLPVTTDSGEDELRIVGVDIGRRKPPFLEC